MKKITILTISMLLSLSAQAQEATPSDGNWRTIARDHYYDGECCYCTHATKTRQSKRPGHGEYFALGKWHEIDDSFIRKPDPKRPTKGIVICDAVKKIYPCVLFDGGM